MVSPSAHHPPAPTEHDAMTDFEQRAQAALRLLRKKYPDLIQFPHIVHNGHKYSEVIQLLELLRNDAQDNNGHVPPSWQIWINAIRDKIPAGAKEQLELVGPPEPVLAVIHFLRHQYSEEYLGLDRQEYNQMKHRISDHYGQDEKARGLEKTEAYASLFAYPDRERKLLLTQAADRLLVRASSCSVGFEVGEPWRKLTVSSFPLPRGSTLGRLWSG